MSLWLLSINFNLYIRSKRVFYGRRIFSKHNYLGFYNNVYLQIERALMGSKFSHSLYGMVGGECWLHYNYYYRSITITTNFYLKCMVMASPC